MQTVLAVPVSPIVFVVVTASHEDVPTGLLGRIIDSANSKLTHDDGNKNPPRQGGAATISFLTSQASDFSWLGDCG
jgi:hypothetical protein